MSAPAQTICLDDIDRRLVDEFQRDVAITPQPFATIGAALGVSQDEVLARLVRLIDIGAVSRFGAVVRPHAAGASTLAALACPPERLDEFADLVSGFAGVTHNYAREHDYNLWFVVTGRAQADVAATLAAIEDRTGLTVLDLPLERAYHIDLGFAMFGERAPKTNACACTAKADAQDKRILEAIEAGAPLVAEPFAAVARQLDMTEADVTDRLAAMLASGVVTRFGVVVKHRAFGYRANAMVVWDIDDARVDEIAAQFANEPEVTLCYRRPRRLPHWRYNLFCMIHATDRAQAQATIARLRLMAGEAVREQNVLFSTRCYKQRGALFSQTRRESAA